MATPKKLKSGRWRVLVFSHMDGNKRRYKSFTADTKAEAARMAAEYQAERRDMPDKTVGQCVDDYIESRAGVLSPSTIRSYWSYLRNMEPVREIKLSRLTAADLQYYISNLSKRTSPKYVRNVYGLLTSAIGQYDDRRFKITLPSRIPYEYHTPDDKDIKLLLESTYPSFRIAILLAACGTLRRGEICALEYSDILYDFSAVYVHRDMVQDKDNKWVIKEMPKTSGSIRRVKLPKEVIELLGEGEGRIYPHTPTSITCAFTRLRNRLGLKCRFHDLRHYSASIMHAIGVPDQYIMERGGWSDDRVLKAVYRNSLKDKAKEFTDRTNKYLSENITKYAT